MPNDSDDLPRLEIPRRFIDRAVSAEISLYVGLVAIAVVALVKWCLA